MKKEFENFSKIDIDIIEYVIHDPGCDGGDIFLMVDYSSDYHVMELIKNGCLNSDSNCEPYNLLVTEKGRAARNEYYLSQDLTNQEIEDNTNSKSKNKHTLTIIGILLGALGIIATLFFGLYGFII